MGTRRLIVPVRWLGCDTALYQTVEAMRAELPARLATGPRVISATAATVAKASEGETLAVTQPADDPRADAAGRVES
jgi:hypothetical protein